MFIRYLLTSWVVFLVCNGIAYSRNLKVADSVGTDSIYSSKTNQNRIGYQKPSGNFYETDSIFSFSSKKGYFPALLHNIGAQSTAPFRFKTKQWLITGALVGITAGIIQVDNDVDEWARSLKQKYNWINKTSPVVTQLGGNYGIYSVIAIGSLSAVFKNQKGVQTSLLATQAMITSGLWVHLIKQLTGRERPKASYVNSKSEGGKWYGPLAQYDQDLAIKKPGSSFDSFPSGHTATAFSIATVFASQYSDIKAIPIISYSVATLVGFSRLTEHQHWPSDVFAGALLGYLCGKQVVANYNKTHLNSITPMSSNAKYKPELTFFLYQNQIGLSLKW